MNGKQSLLIVSVGLLLAVRPAAAHHAFAAEFDADKPVTLRGTLTKMEWVNPHGWIHLEVKQPTGAAITWRGETGAINALLRRGWSKDSLKPGMALVLEGYLARDGSKKMTAMSGPLPDGSKLFAGSAGTGAPTEK